MSKSRKLLILGTVIGALGMLYVVIGVLFFQRLSTEIEYRVYNPEAEYATAYYTQTGLTSTEKDKGFVIDENCVRIEAECWSKLLGTPRGKEVIYHDFKHSWSHKDIFEIKEDAIKEAKRDWKFKVMVIYFLPALLLFAICGGILLTSNKKTPMMPPPTPPMMTSG